jgi:hypothetical protein
MIDDNNELNESYTCILNNNNSNNIYSQYIDYVNNKKKHNINIKSIIIQQSIIMMIYYYLYNVFTITTIDTIFSGLVFVLYYNKKNSEYLYQQPYYIRYIYIILLTPIYYIVKCTCPNILLDLFIMILMMPLMIEIIVNTYKFKKIINKINIFFENMFYYFISKQVKKIITYISKKCLNYTPTINNNEFQPYIKKISVYLFINFISSFFIACLLQYFERNGSTIYTKIFRQIYFRNSIDYNLDDNENIIMIMNNKNWVKLLDPYILNKIIQLYIKINNKENTDIIIIIQNILDEFINVLYKISCCWSLYTIINSHYYIPNIGICLNIVFINSIYKIDIYIKLLIIIIFNILSYQTTEQLLNIILCELFIKIFTNIFIKDIFFDIYKYIVS